MLLNVIKKHLTEKKLNFAFCEFFVRLGCIQQDMAFVIKKSLYPVIVIGVGALVAHFLPSMIKPEKKDLPLIPETQEWKK